MEAQGYTFYVNFCTDANKACNGQDHPSVLYMDSTTCVNIGRMDETYLSLVSSDQPEQGAVLLYDKGEQMFGTFTPQTSIELTCNRELDPSKRDLRFVSEDVKSNLITYRFSMATPYACPGYGQSSGSFFRWGVGATLLTIFCVGVFLYFVIGALVMRFAFKKEGIEIIPNVFFWKDLPRLVWEGILFIADLFKLLIAKISSKKDYSELK